MVVSSQMSALRRERDALEADKRTFRLQLEEFEAQRRELLTENHNIRQQLKQAKEDRQDAETMRAGVERAKDQLHRQEVVPCLCECCAFMEGC